MTSSGLQAKNHNLTMASVYFNSIFTSNHKSHPVNYHPTLFFEELTYLDMFLSLIVFFINLNFYGWRNHLSYHSLQILDSLALTELIKSSIREWMHIKLYYCLRFYSWDKILFIEVDSSQGLLLQVY